MPSTPFCLLVAQLCAVWAGTYEGYLANLLARNEAAQEEFRRNNPSGQFVLNYLDSPQFRRFQPLLTEDETVDTDADAWKAFLADLAYVADAAAKEDPEASAQHLSLAPWTKRPQLNDTPRSAELPVQNHLWGEHRVSGGSSEVGKWVDYAVLGAHAQDDDEEEEEEEGEGVLSGDAADAAHLPDTPFPTYASILTRPAAQTPSGVKLDQLPAYCDPPNPCPIGYDPESLATPCDRNIPNTKEFNRAWIMRKMQNGECPCDEEHMEACPAEKPAFPSASGFLKSVLLHNMDEDNPYLRGRRRASLVAKKFSRQQRRSKARFNPAQRFRLDSNFLGRHRNIVKKDGRRGAKQASSR
uniref:Neuroendocrine protein 7B2 n=1 Tax=Schistocephalus solidus TaxID=70667 RepID=A0A0X3P7P8_SCHSO